MIMLRNDKNNPSHPSILLNSPPLPTPYPSPIFALLCSPPLAIVIDNSSAFRYKPSVPLCVPEINGSTIKGKKLIANPNCTTAIGLMAVNPLLKKFGMKKLIMSTYQASSGAGQEGMDELKEGTKAVVNGERDVAEVRQSDKGQAKSQQ